MITFEKEYTREFSLIMAQLWLYSLDKLCVESGWGVSPEPLYIAHMDDKGISYYQNNAGMRWFIDHMLAENEKGPEYFTRWSSAYNNVTSRLEKYWKRDCDVQDLKHVISVVPDAFMGWDVFYYSAGDERTPRQIREIASRMREKDVLGDDMNRCIVRTLASAYPEFGDYVGQITMDEIENPPAKHELEDRARNYIVHKHGESVILGAYTLVDTLKRHPGWSITSHSADGEMSQVTGQSVYGGTVRGRVRALLRRRQIPDLQDGEVIVTHMTTPDFVPAMKRAAAIVTDEGGITCHAAIIARELKKPCIIGTKVATQVFKDGDMVEVDADNGIVRKL